jgi:hypothetical protein
MQANFKVRERENGFLHAREREREREWVFTCKRERERMGFYMREREREREREIGYYTFVITFTHNLPKHQTLKSCVE